jgi:hypothetical protein
VTDKSGQDEPKRKAAKKLTVLYPDHRPRPEELLDFIELPVFTRRWKELGLDDEDDLAALQLFIMAEPKRAKVVGGTPGIRKLRFAPERWNCGKSGGARILYVHFDQLGIVVLCYVFGKNETDNISNAVKKYLAKLVVDIEKELHRRFDRR